MSFFPPCPVMLVLLFLHCVLDAKAYINIIVHHIPLTAVSSRIGSSLFQVKWRGVISWSGFNVIVSNGICHVINMLVHHSKNLNDVASFIPNATTLNLDHEMTNLYFK
jgi:hypothetical protein